MYCGEATLVNTAGDNCRAITLFCRSWGCAHCQPKRQAQLRGMARDGKPTTFITLTVSPATSPSAEVAAKLLADAWRKTVKRIKRTFHYKHVEYFAVFEATKAGRPHLHILARIGFVPQKWLSHVMDEMIKAPIVDIRRVKSAKQAAYYVAKYVGKEPGKFGTCKRYWHTKNWDVSSDEVEVFDGCDPTGWRIVKQPLREVVRLWAGAGILLLAVTPSGAYGHKYKPPPRWDRSP